MAFTVYILQCADQSLYVGHTDNFDLRMQQHDAGTDGSYTATRRPLNILHAEPFETRYEAIAAERKLKGWSRAKKLAYVRGDWPFVTWRRDRTSASTPPADAGCAQREREVAARVRNARQTPLRSP